MGDSGGGKGVVIAIQPRHRAQALCSCGWLGRSRLMLSAAKLDAFIHASRCGCEPGIPLVQPEAIDLLKPPGVLTVECPAGCGVRLAVPLEIVDLPSVGADLDVRFVAEAPELHDYIYTHLRTCPSPRPRSVEATLHKAAG